MWMSTIFGLGEMLLQFVEISIVNFARGTSQFLDVPERCLLLLAEARIVS